MKQPISCSLSSEPRYSGALMIPIIGSGSGVAPVFLSVYLSDCILYANIKHSKQVSSEYYLKQLLTKAEARNYLGCSDTSLDRLSKAYPMIKGKIGTIVYNRIEIDNVINGMYN